MNYVYSREFIVYMILDYTLILNHIITCRSGCTAIRTRLYIDTQSYNVIITCRSGCTAIRTILAPDKEAKLLSANCCEIVHGMRSPDALLPRDKLFITEPLLIAPSRHTYNTHTHTHTHTHVSMRD